MNHIIGNPIKGRIIVKIVTNIFHKVLVHNEKIRNAQNTKYTKIKN
jgi:hypothetical protein